MGLELVGKVVTAFFFEQVIVLKRITACNDYLIFFFITLIHFTFYYFYLIFLKFFLEEIDVGKIAMASLGLVLFWVSRFAIFLT